MFTANRCSLNSSDVFVIVMQGVVISGTMLKKKKKSFRHLDGIIFNTDLFWFIKVLHFSLETFASAKVMAALTSVYKSGI